MAKTTKKEQLSNADLFVLLEGLDALATTESGADFSFKVVKNLKLIQEEIEVVQKLSVPTKEYKEKYQSKVDALAKEHCKKDDNGQPSTNTQNGRVTYNFDPDGKEKFNEAVEKLKSDPEVKSVLEERQKQIDKYNEVLKKPADITLTKIKKEELPEKITPQQMYGIYDLIE